MTANHALEDLLSVMGEVSVEVPRELTNAEAQLEYVSSRTGIAAVSVALGLHWQEHLTGYYLVDAEQGLTALIPYGIGKYVFYDQGLQRFQCVDRNTEVQFRKQAWEITPSLKDHDTPLRFMGYFLKNQAQAEVPWMLIMMAVLLFCAMRIPYLGFDALWNVIPSGNHFVTYVVQLGGVLLCGGIAAMQFRNLLQRIWEKADLQYATALTQRFLQRNQQESKKAAAACQLICASVCKTVVKCMAWIGCAVSFGVVAVLGSAYRTWMLELFGLAGLLAIVYMRMLWRTIPQQEASALTSRLAGQAWLCQMEIEKNVPDANRFVPNKNRIFNSTFGYITALSTAFLAMICVQGIAVEMRPAILVAYGLRAALCLFCMLQFISCLPEFVRMQYWTKTVFADLSEESPRDMRPAMLQCDGSLVLERVCTTHLHEISLQLYPGEKIGIYGAAGSGKTTVLKLVAGILPIQFGAVYSSGRDCAQVQGQSWRRCIRFLQKADTVQIACAVRSEASILLLDQVCDPETAKCALAFSGTCMIATTRKKWLVGCDRIFRLENGQLTQEGW